MNFSMKPLESTELGLYKFSLFKSSPLNDCIDDQSYLVHYKADKHVIAVAYACAILNQLHLKPKCHCLSWPLDHSL